MIKVNKVVDYVTKNGPKEGNSFSLDIDDLMTFACVISAVCEALNEEKKLFIDVPDEQKELYVRMALTIVEGTEEIKE